MINRCELFLLNGPDRIACYENCKPYAVFRRFPEPRPEPKDELLPLLQRRQWNFEGRLTETFVWRMLQHGRDHLVVLLDGFHFKLVAVFGFCCTDVPKQIIDNILRKPPVERLFLGEPSGHGLATLTVVTNLLAFHNSLELFKNRNAVHIRGWMAKFRILDCQSGHFHAVYQLGMSLHSSLCLVEELSSATEDFWR